MNKGNSEMEKLFEGLSVTLTNDDVSTLKDRIQAEKAEWMKAAQADEKFIGDLRTKSEGKIYSTVERWLKKSTGLKFEDLSAELKGGERFREMLDTAITEIKSTKDQTNDELQNQLLAIKEEARILREEEIPKIELSYKSKFNEKQIETKLAEKLAGMNLIPERINPARIYAKAVLKDLYKLDWDDETGLIDIKTKQDIAPVIDDKVATLDDVLNNVLDEGGFILKSNGSQGNTRTTNTTGKVTTPGKIEWSENARAFAEKNGVKL